MMVDFVVVAARVLYDCSGLISVYHYCLVLSVQVCPKMLGQLPHHRFEQTVLVVIFVILVLAVVQEVLLLSLLIQDFW
jgi:hypothetical protein